MTTTGFPAAAITRGGDALPSGVTFVDNGNGTATLSGMPNAGTDHAGLVSRMLRRHGTSAATRSPDRSQSVNSARAALSFVLVRRLGYRVADVAAALGRDPATISVIVSRLASRLGSNDRIAADVARLSRNV